MNCHVRYMEPKDVEQCFDIEFATYANHGMLATEFDLAIKQQYMLALVACDGDVVVGYCTLMVRKSGLYIYRLVVRKDRRRMLVGSSMLAWIIRLYNHHPIVYSMDDTSKDEHYPWFVAGQEFLRANGFKLGKVIRRKNGVPCYQFFLKQKVSV